MSEKAVAQLAKSLDLPLDQANAVWLKVREAMFNTVRDGDPLDLGFAYIKPAFKKPRKRHDFGANATIHVPGQTTLKILVPPHAQDALAGKAALSPYIFMTRSQIKGLPDAERDALARQRLDYYRLKGVTG